jgi:hypothetical protein
MGDSQARAAPLKYNSMRHSLLLSLAASCTTMMMSAGHAQKLPPVSRMVFKCEVLGNVVYSDAPCLGAKPIDVEPTRGLDQSSGRRRVGSDVLNEQMREAMAEGIRPVTGMDAKQLAVQGRRNQLSANAQQECRRLDGEIPSAQQKVRIPLIVTGDSGIVTADSGDRDRAWCCAV